MQKALIVFISIALLVLAFAHFALYEVVVTIFPGIVGGWLVGLRIVFVALAVSFIAASAVSHWYNNIFTRILYRIASVWIGLMLYLIAASLVYILIGKFGAELLVLALILGLCGFINASYVRVTRYAVSLPGLPESWKGKTIVLMTDIHLGQIRGVAFARKVTALVNSLQPEMVLISGDLYDGVKVDENAVVAPLGGLMAPKGIYFVTGNHEEFGSNEHFLAAIRKVGIRVLINELVMVDGLQIVGVDDRDSNESEKFASIMSGMRIDRGVASILMKHQPTLLSIAAEAGVSLQVSGHTHRGQVWPFSLITRRIFKGFDYGLHTFKSAEGQANGSVGGPDTMQVLTSSGAGTWGPPFRLGTRAEVVAFTLN